MDQRVRDLHREVEDFLFAEAELLDSWRLPEWLELFTEDAQYLVPSPGLPPDASPADNLFLVYDDRERLEGRVARLMKKSAHAEYPHSKTLHLMSNVRATEMADSDIQVRAAFVTYRTKDGSTDRFIGRSKYLLVRDGAAYRIREKRCDLEMDSLNPQGRVTIIL